MQKKRKDKYPPLFYIFVTCLSLIAVILGPMFFIWILALPFPPGLENAKSAYISAPQQIQTEASSYYYDHDLNDAQKKNYAKIENALRVMADGVYLVEPLSVLETTRTYNAVLSDNPDIFWCAKSKVKYAENPSGVFMLKFTYTCSPDEVADKAVLYEESAKNTLSKITGETDTDKAKDIASYICDNTDYVKGDLDHSIDGVFGNRQATCGGYAKAMKYMCDIAGIPCIYVHGYIGADPFATHAWNEVHADGTLYSVDATWKESSENEEDWFSADTSTFRKSRTPSFMEVVSYFEDFNQLPR